MAVGWRRTFWRVLGVVYLVLGGVELANYLVRSSKHLFTLITGLFWIASGLASLLFLFIESRQRRRLDARDPLRADGAPPSL